MAQRIQGLTLGFLDLDNEERFIQKGDYTNALNIRRFASSEGVAYPVKNVVGNVAVGNILPEGINTCIGQTVLSDNNTLYFAIHNSNRNHGLYQYNSVTDQVTKIVEDSYLNFSLSKYITGFNAVASLVGDGILLYWTDDFNPPRKINVKRAILHSRGDFINGYAPNFSSGTTLEKDKYYDAIKHPPTKPITFEFIKNPNLGINNINNRTFQFRYRYIYDDGERSAYSPWSKLAFSPLLRGNNTYDVNYFDDQYNSIFLNFEPATSNNVEKVELTFREGNNGDEFLWDVVDNSLGTNAAFFNNDTLQNIVGSEDSLKPYDAVPILAKAQEYYGGKLFYANTVDGYDQTKINGDVTPVYNSAFDFENNKEVISISNSGDTPTIHAFKFDFSNVSLEEGKTIVIAYGYDFRLTSSSFIYNLRVNLTYEIQPNETINTLLNNIANLIVNYNYPSNIKSIYSNIYFFIRRNEIEVYYRTANTNNLDYFTETLFNDSYAVSNGEAVSTHKGGSFHPYGIVYYDRAGRSSTVNKIDSPYVKFFSERDGSLIEGLGSVNMALSIRNTPPSWATHWQPVYAGNNNISEYLQYTCAGVYKGKSQVAGNGFDRIYISMRNFKGSDNSWKDSTGALPDYNYVEGDRLRVWSFDDGTQRVSLKGNLDVKVVDFVFLGKNDENPLYDSSDAPDVQERKSGWFLIIEDPKTFGFNIQSVGSDSYWFNESRDEGAYFEIYRVKPKTDNLVYYEIAEKYEIGNVGLPNRYHKGGVRNQNETGLSYSVSLSSNLGGSPYYVLDNANAKIIAGDVVEASNASVTFASQTVLKTDVNINGKLLVYVDSDVDASTTTLSLITQSSATLITSGDSYYKSRTLFRGNSVVSYPISIVGVESYYLNDFISTGDSWDKGRVNSFSEEQRQLRRPSTVWVSEALSPDTAYNGLSAFNLSNIPYRDYPLNWGGIQIMKQNNQGLILWHEDKTSKILIDRNVLESAEGNQTITISDQTLGQFIPYKGDYGISQQPESLFGNDGDWYWTDIKRGAALRLANDGITPISDYKIRQYLYKESREYLANYSKARIVGGYDVENDEAVWTWPKVTQSNIEIDGNDFSTPIPNASIDATTLSVEVELLNEKPTILGYNNNPLNWSERTQNWDERFRPLYSLLDVAESNSIGIEGVEGDLAYVTLETETNFTVANINRSSGLLELDTNNPEYPTITGNEVIVKDGFTIAFYEPANRWSTFYSFTPEIYASLNGTFIGFKNGSLHKFGLGSLYNNFFGVQYDSKLTPVVNDSPFDVKSFYAAWIEGNDPWDINISTNLNSTSLLAADFINREGRYYQQLPFSNVGTTDSNTIGLGSISSISGNNVVINGFNSAGLNLFVGDEVYSDLILIGNITAINSDGVTLSNVSSLSNGDYIYIRRNGFVDGDRIRGFYAKMEMTNNTTDKEVELYSVDLNASKSFR